MPSADDWDGDEDEDETLIGSILTACLCSSEMSLIKHLTAIITITTVPTVGTMTFSGRGVDGGGFNRGK